jgi:hypothetical protein
MFTIPNVAWENAMACRVFRVLKFDSTQSYIDRFVIEVCAHGSLPRLVSAWLLTQKWVATSSFIYGRRK